MGNDCTTAHMAPLPCVAVVAARTALPGAAALTAKAAKPQSATASARFAAARRQSAPTKTVQGKHLAHLKRRDIVASAQHGRQQRRPQRARAGKPRPQQPCQKGAQRQQAEEKQPVIAGSVPPVIALGRAGQKLDAHQRV